MKNEKQSEYELRQESHKIKKRLAWEEQKAKLLENSIIIIGHIVGWYLILFSILNWFYTISISTYTIGYLIVLLLIGWVLSIINSNK